MLRTASAAARELIEHRAIRHALIEAEREAFIDLRDRDEIKRQRPAWPAARQVVLRHLEFATSSLLGERLVRLLPPTHTR